MAYTGLPRPMLMRLVTAVVFGMLVVWWVIALAGTAAAHKECVDETNAALSASRSTTSTINAINLSGLNLSGLLGRRLLGVPGRQLLSAADETCQNLFSFPWWIIWFEFIVIACAIAVAFNDSWTARFLPVVVISMAVEMPLLMYYAATTNSKIYGLKGTGSNMLSALQCTLAGLVGLCVFNGVYLICSVEASGTLVLGFKAGGVAFTFGSKASTGGSLPSHNSVPPPGVQSPAVVPVADGPAHAKAATPEVDHH